MIIDNIIVQTIDIIVQRCSIILNINLDAMYFECIYLDIMLVLYRVSDKDWMSVDSIFTGHPVYIVLI